MNKANNTNYNEDREHDTMEGEKLWQHMKRELGITKPYFVLDREQKKKYLRELKRFNSFYR